MESALFSRRDGLKKEFAVQAENAVQNDFERSSLLIRIVSKFGQILRNISVGDYRDEFSQSSQEVRIKHHISEIICQLQKSINLKAPDFDSKLYGAKLSDNLTSMRGRELLGFTSARLMMGSVLTDLEALTAEVDAAFSSATDVFALIANRLIDKVAVNFPALQSALSGVTEQCCVVQSTEMNKRASEIFERSTGGGINDKELINSINRIRWERFEQSTKESLVGATGTSKEDMKKHVKLWLGRTYMQSHAVGSSFQSQTDEALAALKAYWRVSTTRLIDDVTSCIEMVLLQGCPALIETTLTTQIQNWSTQPALSQMLEEDPGSLIRKKDLQEELSVIELQISNIDQGGKARVLQSREADADVAIDLQAHGSSSSSVNTIRKGSSSAGLASVSSSDIRPIERTQVAEFTHESDGDDNGLIFWLGTRGYTASFSSPMSFGQLNVRSSGVLTGTYLGDEDSLVSRLNMEVILEDMPSCWLCVDVGRTRAVSPTLLCLRHGCPQQGKDILNWDAEGRDLQTSQWISLTFSAEKNRNLGLGIFTSQSTMKSFSLNSRGTEV